MNPWSAAVHALAAAIRWVGGWLGGGLALGIPVTTFAIRTALIPLLGPLSVRTRDRTRIVRRIRPQIKELNKRYKDHPGDLSRRLKALHAENGIGVVDWSGLGGAMVQLPILIALFEAVLSLWEPEALTAGGAALGVVAAALSTLATRLSGQSEGAQWMLWLSAGLPVAICLWLGAGIGLYLTGFYAAGAIQGFLMPRDHAPEAQAEST